MIGYRTGLLPFDPRKHARFTSAAQYGFPYQPVTYPIDRTEGITDWGMGGNGPDPTLTANGGQPVGDCGVCAVPMHAKMLTAVLTGLPLADHTMTSDEVVTLYFRYTGGQDTGVDLGDFLLWLFQQGIIEGFVKIDLPHLDQALQLFNVIVVGADLNPQADQQFPNGWDVGPNDEPDPQRGHAILYAGAESATGPFKWISWGAVATSTLNWRMECPQQAFAVLTQEEAQAKGFTAQYEALLADLRAMGGTVVPDTPAPVPTPPAPTPAPSPPPPPPEAVDWLHRLITWLEGLI